jgi:hypothetical protein
MVMEEIFNKLIKNNLTPNQFYILWCKKDSLTPLLNLNLSLENMRLVSDEWITADGLLTSKSIILIQEIESHFKVSKKKTSKAVMGENFMENIEAYLDLFPKFKLPSGKYARSDKKNLEGNFRWFFDSHSYSWETIFDATKLYLDQYERQGYKYMRTSQYFIRKQNADKTYDSELANYCDMITNGETGMNDNYFSEKVF